MNMQGVLTLQANCRTLATYNSEKPQLTVYMRRHARRNLIRGKSIVVFHCACCKKSAVNSVQMQVTQSAISQQWYSHHFTINNA